MFGVNRYGRPLDQLDRFSDAGLRVSVQRRPYWGAGREQLRVQEQELACAREAVHTLREAERGVAPCVLAMFCSGGDRARVAGEWRRLRRPNMAAVAEVVAAEGAPVENLVTVQQVSTFSLADVMSDLREAQSKARREQLKSVLRRACEMALEQTFKMCEPHEGFGIAKLNMMPETVVFCPELVASGSSWTLEGIGHRPMSDEHLDGVAKLSGFDAVLTTRVPESHYSVDTSCAFCSNPCLTIRIVQLKRRFSS